MVRDWDKGHEEKEFSTKFNIGMILMVSFIFSCGFLVGAFWGMAFTDAVEDTPFPVASGFEWEETKNYNTSLKDTMSFGDTITVRLLNGTT